MLAGDFVYIFRINAKHPGRELVIHVNNLIVNIKITGRQIYNGVAQL